MLRKTIAISFLLVFLCANTEMGQLLKLPNLIHHFLEHHDHDDNEPNISFSDFIIIHYNNNQQHSDKDDHDNHQNLPFKTLNSSLNTVLDFENPTVFSFCEPTIIFINSTVPFCQEFYTSDVFACIWLPPKLS
ncbi:hypothetical protein H4V97_001125 [Flavobacterium sp. CG_23.5]|uniref:hypothetical protein n=1 Tax=Flavobacterium sp. CG_23.5 TaxID=2760708 RepID=UPI001EBDCEB0|nr:hypothetical protein [Flavobacterium sp. CG_23.5]MBP2282807.1 hypothetical protein [Flavobacterium sp. CG_23.5]